MGNNMTVAIVVLALCGFLAASPKLPAVESGLGRIEQSDRPYTHLSIGGGYGLNYGGIGVNFEFNPQLPFRGKSIHNYTSIILGFGMIPEGGVSYLLGLNLYPLGRELMVQPRLSAAYGVVGLVRSIYVDPGEERRCEGVAFGAGVLFQLTRDIAIDGDVQLILPVDWNVDDLEGGQIRFSAGLRYRL